MRDTSAIRFSAVLAACILAGCSHQNDAPGRNAVPHEITAVLENSTQFVLLSVDPLAVNVPHILLDPSKEVFHDHAILGSVVIQDKAQRASLLRALYNGIGQSGFGKSKLSTVRLCFNPRHGIHATNGNVTVDLLICFECWQVGTYTHDGVGMMTTTDSPQKTFDEALKAAHVPLAPPKAPNQAMQPTASPRTASLSYD